MIHNDLLQIWKIPLNIAISELQSLFNILSQEEQQIALRFKFEKHYRRYVVSHAAMRNILAKQLNISHQKIIFEISGNGKPFIQKNPLQFNLSHSEEIAMLAISCHGDVGIDVEYMKDFVDVMGITQRFFHPIELNQLQKIDAEDRLRHFYYCWTAKEAYLKAKGVGIANHLKMFAVDFQDISALKILWAHKELIAFNDWYIQAFEPQQNYIATVVSATKPKELIINEYRFDHLSRE